MDKHLDIAYSYLRFSNRGQEHGHSIERQMEAAADWCDRNGVALDSVTTFRDLGKSAFTGDHRKNPDRNALALFLEMVKPGPMRRIPPGSFLIIENLDRLTREHIQPALLLVLTLLQYGIRIVQLKPAEVVYDDKSDTLAIMMMIVELSRGNSESVMKSDRIGKAWRKKKDLARSEGRPMRTNAPPWLRVVGGKFVKHEPSVKIVRRIFEMSIAGHGIQSIVKALIRERVPALVPSGQWGKTFVGNLLKGRRVLGEHQPVIVKDGKPVPDGPPIPNYYPAIIDERTWLLAREALQTRLRHRGRQSGNFNVFKGLLKNPIDGGSYCSSTRYSRGRKGGKPVVKRILINVEGTAGRATVASFPFDVFEHCILSELREIDPKEIQDTRPGDGEMEELLAEKRKNEERIGKLEEALTDEQSDAKAVARAIKRLSDRNEEADRRIAELRRLQISRASEEWPSGVSLMDTILSHPGGPREARLRLRSVFYRTIEGIWLVVGGIKKHIRVCCAQVYFRDSSTVRTYVFWFRPKHVTRGKKTEREAGYFVDSAPFPFRSFSLKNREDAMACLEVLTAGLPEALPWQVWPVAKRKTRG